MVIHIDTEGLSYNEKKLLLALAKRNGTASPDELIGEGVFSLEVEVMGAASWLVSKGLADIRESVSVLYTVPDPERLKEGLPERQALEVISENGGRISMEKLAEAMHGGDKIAVGWLRRKKLADVVKEDGSKILVLSDIGKMAVGSDMPDEILLKKMLDAPVSEEDADKKIIKDLKGRKGLIAAKELTEKVISLTNDGHVAAASGLELKKEITDVTDEIIQSGRWKDADFRKYDIQTFAPAPPIAKKNPLTRLGDDIKRLFVEMGFTEMSSEYVQPAFWNMDVLFIPQDHPARDMQDTFFLDEPSVIELKDKVLVQKVKDLHENGGDTGSTGWGGKWSIDNAQMPLLRTHSTVSSIKYIADHPDAPQKAFSISRIFRKESIDSTHLPEFSQIEGIVIDEHGDFNMLISLIREFYHRMGFDRIRIRPAYFPYTEPSLELEVFFNGKWMELGGAGIFRPEVVKPFGVEYPVLAWGFGFERLAMLKWNVTDIRDLYISDIDGLKRNPIL